MSRDVRGRQRRPAPRSRAAGGSDAVLRLQRQAGNQAVSALLTRAAPPLLTVDDALALQRAGGNQAVTSLVADVDDGFNVLDVTHRLLIAIDQEQVDIRTMTRHVDFPAVAATLSNLTPAEARQVWDAYLAHEGRTLYNDLFGSGESGAPSDLTYDQLMRIDALLGGTRAGSPEEALVVAAHRREADAVELHALLHGDLDEDGVERVMTLLRRSATANEQLAGAYANVTRDTLTADLGRMGPVHAVRALTLFGGDPQRADSMKVGGQRARFAAIDARIADLGHGLPALAEARALREERKGLVEDIERRLGRVGAEARDVALARGADARTADDAAQARVAAVAGDVGELAAAAGGTDAAVIRAEASGDPVASVAARLRKAAEAGDLDAAQLTAALRGLREEAEARARRELRDGGPDEVAARARSIAEGYFARLRPAYTEVTGGRELEELIAATGDEDDYRLNESLLHGGGRLADLDELVLALHGDRKDVATVERVLRGKPAGEIATLKAAYLARTGKALDRELFGLAPTRAGEEDPEALGVHLVDQGKASGTERLNLEDALQRPDREGGPEEVEYICARAEREYEYTIEHRGVTGWWRDAWGNEQRALLDETITRVRRLHMSYLAGVVRPEWARSEAAHRMVQDLRLARATIRGDRAAYEKATAELRATFQAVAAFALQVALTAVLGPAVELAFAAEAGEAVTAGIQIARAARSAAVATAATIGSNLAAYGSDYSLAMLKADLLGGMGGAIGPLGVDRMVGPYAKALASRLGPRVSAEIITLGRNVASMETAAWAQGRSADIGVEGIAKARLAGAMTDAIRGRLEPRRGAPPPGMEPAPVEPRAAAGELAPEPTQVTGTPAGAVLQAEHPQDLVASFKLYKRQIAADPRREVALLYNHANQEWAVVQGERGMVPTLAGMRALGWEVRDTTVGRHSHPVGAGGQTSEANVLASGRGGDVEMVRGDSYKGEPGGGAQWHAIDVTMAGGRADRTWIFYSRETGLWTVDYPDAGERGGRGRVSFSSMDQYHRWFEARFGFEPGPARGGTGGGPAAADDVGLTGVEPGQEHVLDDPVYQVGIEEASEAFAGLVDTEQRKNVAGVHGGEMSTSGTAGEKAALADRARIEGMEAGYETRPHIFDRGEEGSFDCAHSERHRAVETGRQSLASAKVLCPGCVGWFAARASHEGRPYFVADPAGVHVFLEDGRYTVEPHVSGAVTEGRRPPSRRRGRSGR